MAALLSGCDRRAGGVAPVPAYVQHLRTPAGDVVEVEVLLMDHLPLVRDRNEQAVGPPTAPLQPVHLEPSAQRTHVHLEDVW